MVDRETTPRAALPIALAGAAACAVPLAVYLLTLARDVTFVDSGELATAAITLGIAHPPGYPLFTLLGHILSWLPVGLPVARVAVLSALATAAASWFVWRTARALVDPEGRSGVVAWAALAGALLFAFARTVWSQAVIVEVYALQAALTAACLAAMLAAVGATGWPRSGLRGAGLLFGLCLANHLTGALLLPSLLVAVACVIRDRRRAGQAVAGPVLRALAWTPLPLLLYALLPLRSRMDPLVNWDYPDTLPRLLIHVSARQYQGNLGREGLRLGELQRFALNQLPTEATLVLPLLAIVGLVLLLRRRPRAVAVTAPLLVAQILYNMAYPIHDIAVYYIPVVLVLGLWAGVGAAGLARWAASRAAWPRQVAGVTAAAVLAALGVLPIARNFAASDMHHFHLARYYVHDALAYADPGAVIVSGQWDRFTAPALYLRTVENLRPDVVILDVGRLGSPMLARDLAHTFPELATACAPELAAMREIAFKAERGEAYDVARSRQLYQALQYALVHESQKQRPTYALGGVFRHPMFAGLRQHPEGLLVRMTSDADYRPFAVPAFEGPGVAPAGLRTHLERDTYAEYLRLLDGRIKYLQAHGQTEQVPALQALVANLGGS